MRLAYMAQELELTAEQRERVNAIFDANPGKGIIAVELDAGRKVVIPGFGTFTAKRRSARTGTNPATGEKITKILLVPSNEDGARVDGPARLVDTAVGRGARVGPRVVTEGEERGRVVVGDDARIGAGTVLLAPVTVGEGTHVEAGSVLGGEHNG